MIEYIESPVVTFDSFHSDEELMIIHNYVNMKGKIVLNKAEAALLWLELYEWLKPEPKANSF